MPGLAAATRTGREDVDSGFLTNVPWLASRCEAHALDVGSCFDSVWSVDACRSEHDGAGMHAPPT